jgi:hypothetical protein
VICYVGSNVQIILFFQFLTAELGTQAEGHPWLYVSLHSFTDVSPQPPKKKPKTGLSAKQCHDTVLELLNKGEKNNFGSKLYGILEGSQLLQSFYLPITTIVERPDPEPTIEDAFNTVIRKLKRHESIQEILKKFGNTIKK